MCQLSSFDLPSPSADKCDDLDHVAAFELDVCVLGAWNDVSVALHCHSTFYPELGEQSQNRGSSGDLALRAVDGDFEGLAHIRMHTSVVSAQVVTQKNCARNCDHHDTDVLVVSTYVNEKGCCAWFSHESTAQIL